MQQWTGEERAFAIKAYYQNGESLVRAQRAFRTHFNVPHNRPVPSNHAINTWVDNFEVSGSTSKKRGGGQKSVQTPENIERVREAFERSPRRSAVRHSTTLGITPRSVRKILHNDLHYHPYKIQIIQRIQDEVAAFLWRCCERSWTISGPDLKNACVEMEAILRALLSKHKFSNWHKTKWLFICFSFMANKQTKNSCVDFFFMFWNFPVSLPPVLEKHFNLVQSCT